MGERNQYLITEPSHADHAESMGMSQYPSLWEDLSLALFPNMGPSIKIYDFSGKRNYIYPGDIYGTSRFKRLHSQWGLDHTATGSSTSIGLIDDLVALNNVTFVLGYEKTDAVARTSGIFGSNTITSAEYCGVMRWSGGQFDWEFGGTIGGAGSINTTTHGSGSPVMGDDCWVFTSGNSRGMEIWQNGKRIAHNATANRTRQVDAAKILKWGSGSHDARTSDLAIYKYFIVYNRVLSIEEIDLISTQPKALLIPRRTLWAGASLPSVITKSLSDPMTLVSVGSYNIIFPRASSHALGVTDSASAVGDKPESVSSVMSLIQLAEDSGDNGASNAIVLSQNVLYVNLISDRQVPEHGLGLSDTAHAFGSETISHALGLTDSVSTIGPISEGITSPLGVFDHAHGCISAPWETIEISHFLGLSHWTNIPFELAIADPIVFSDSGDNIYTGAHVINFLQEVISGLGISLSNELALSDTLEPDIGYERSSTHTTLLKDAFTYYIDSGCNRKYYNRFEGSGETTGIEEDHLTFDANFAIESLSGTKELLYLRSPETDDKQRIGYNRVNRETSGGELNVFQDSSWPQVHTLLFTIVALSDGDCYPDKIGSLMDFFQTNLGKEILIHDWEGISWRGVVTTPNETAVEDSDGWWTISFEFVGEAFDGSQGDQQMSIQDSVGLAADWVRSVSDDLGVSDASEAGILGTIAVSVSQVLGMADAVSGGHEHPTLEDDFSGAVATNLHGQSPDTGSSTWSAHSNYKADGSQTGVDSGAYYPFAPGSGKVYYIEWEARSLAENDGDETRFFLGEGLNSDHDDEGGVANGNTDPTTLKAGFVMRKVTTQHNACRLGDGLDGQADTADFTDATLMSEADDLDMRLVLDTSLGAGLWSASWLAKDPADSSWTEVRSSESLLSEDITTVGWSNDNATTTVTMNNISILERATL